MVFDANQLTALMPEVFLCVATMALLLFGVASKEKNVVTLLMGAMAALGFTLLMLWQQTDATRSVYDGLFQISPYITVSKILVVLASLLVMFISREWLRKMAADRFEYPLLMLLSIVGMMVMVSSGNLLTLYMGLELTSLPLYVLAAFQRDSLRSTESGLKYFVLGSLASGMMLFGISLVYGFSGTLDFATLGDALSYQASLSAANETPMQIATGLVVGLLLIITGLCFKVSAVPFHMWTPDVYEGAPTPVTAFFAVAPKIAALTIFARLLMQPFGDLVAYWQQVVVFVSVGSMLVGALGAIVQSNLKRLLAYSSIGHVGYAMIGVATGALAGAEALLIYLSIYLVMSVGAFGCILLMRRKHLYVEEMDELAGLGESRPAMAAAIAIFMFSLAGIPPLAGFFGKMYIFLAAVEHGLYGLAVVGVLSSVIAAFYYLKIVKIMYFDEAKRPFDRDESRALRSVVLACSAFVLLFFLYPTPLVDFAKEAAKSLLG